MSIDPYIIGKRYRVPVVEATVSYFRTLWPVIGPWHEDAEFIRFEDQHYHIDARFLSKRLYRKLTRNHRLRELGVFATVIIEQEHEPIGPVQMKWRRCRREFPEYPRDRVPWIRKLEAAYAERRIDSRLVCPHRGASLQGLTPDAAGCVTCPLHGLRWSCRTGHLVAGAGQ